MKHLQDSYVRECAAAVTGVPGGSCVTLSETYFYPEGGGQPHDEGILRRTSDGKEFRVVMARKGDGGILHEVDAGGLAPGDEVAASIDWARRYGLMRAHTAAHVVSALIRQRTGALITGNQLGLEKVRIDFAVEEFDPELFKGILQQATGLIAKGAPVTTAFVTREEALSEPALAGLAKGLPAHDTIRVLEITGLDRQACGGTHVRDIAEIGPLAFLKAENKGKRNRRLSFALANKL